MMSYVKYLAKSILAFLGLLATNVATRWVVNGEPLPASTSDWVAFGVTTIGGTWLVFRTSNGPKPAGKPDQPAT